MDTEEAAEGGLTSQLHVRAKHIKKRSLKNKALSISFDEKDLKDYVTGFHKRKKKRRKEANLQIQEADRKKRIELRKKRKLDRDFVLYGGAPPPNPDGSQGEADEEQEDLEESETVASVSGTTTYESGNVQVIVTTSEISPEEDDPTAMSLPVKPPTDGSSDQKKQKIPVIKKKPLKKVAKKRPQKKTQSKRDKRKGKTQQKKR